MRHINRLGSPKILADKHDEWQRKFDEKRAEKPASRPDSTKYAHKDIRKQLMSMSHGKCFYCEGALTDNPKEVDHFIEVAIDPSKAYEWKNLYLSCPNCNDKIPHDKIPIDTALDPCRDSDDVIKANITFDSEVIRPVPDSALGMNTIQKFRLDTELLDSKRAKWLNRIMRTITEILKDMVADGRKIMNDDEVMKLKIYMHPSSPYSLMSEIYIKTNLRRLIPWPI